MTGVERMVAAGAWPERTALRTLFEIGRRPRGARLLQRIPLAADLVRRLVEMQRYERQAVSASLGFDADAVVARGRELRRSEQRP